jgi:tetratricopeptide (TPR) repeat protein
MKKISFGPIWDEIQKVRMKEWKQAAINLANEYLAKDPFKIEAYLQLIDIYYVMWELEKAEKPIDFILKNKISHQGIDLGLLYYVKAVLLSERTQWQEAKKYIKKALSYNETNPEYKRLLAMIEFWSWNKTRWYELIKELVSQLDFYDADILLDAVNMAFKLWYIQEAKRYVDLYFENKANISFFSKDKSFYDKKMNDFKIVLKNLDK